MRKILYPALFLASLSVSAILLAQTGRLPQAPRLPHKVAISQEQMLNAALIDIHDMARNSSDCAAALESIRRLSGKVLKAQ